METDFGKLLELCRLQGVNVHSDSRQVGKGDIFVAVPGASQDGSAFIGDALERGAAYIVCSPDAAAGFETVRHENPREALWRLAQARWHTDALPLKVVGITGTNGKTTSAYLLEHLFTAAGFKTGVLGTVSYRWPGFSQAAPLTTPDPLALHAMLAKMAAAGVEVVIMEISSHALAQQRVGGIAFSGALFSNLTQDHLDFHKNMESYFQAKARLFTELPQRDKAMAINGDDPYGQRLLALLPDAVSFGLGGTESGGRRLSGLIISHSPKGMRLRMRLAGEEWELESPLVGEFNALNLLGAQALALGLGLAPEHLASLRGFRGVCGRLERVENNRGLDVFVDYAHTPDALANALKALRGSGFRRIVTVFGCGGNRDRTKRPLMGKAVAEYSDVAILTSDNPRFEDPDAIIEDVRPGLAGAARAVIEPDRRKATEIAIGMLGKGDALLIAGKGHEDYQIIQGRRHHYSDQEVARELLNCA